MRKRRNDLERCTEEMGCDLFDSAVQVGWAERLRSKRSESNQRMECEVQAAPRFQPLGYGTPVKGLKINQPNETLAVKGGSHSDPFNSRCYVVGPDLLFRVSMTAEADGKYHTIRHAWYALREWPRLSISQAVGMMEESFGHYAADMLTPIMRKLKRPYWPLRPSNVEHIHR